METTQKNNRKLWLMIAVWVLIVAAMSVSFGHNFGEMWVRWFPAWQSADMSLWERLMEGESYYTHAPLVPFVSLIIAVLLIRHTRIPVRPDRKWGGIVLGFFVLTHMLACLARVNFASGFAFIGVLAGLVLLIWGRAALRRLWFPLAMLVFMVPLPEVSIAQLNFRLKMFASRGGVTIADFIGVPVEGQGNQVFLEGGKRLVIANVCNGLRTLISLLAFGALYAYVCRLKGWWRIGLFLMSVPIAVVANSVRIVSLIVVADAWDAEVATGWFHDWSGVLIFVLAFLLMFGLEKMILGFLALIGRPVKVEPLFHGQLRGDEDAEQWQEMMWAGGQVRSAVATGMVIVSAVGALWLGRTIPTVLGPGKLEAAAVVEIEIDGRKWVAESSRELDEQTLVILEHPTYLIRQYRPEYRPADNFHRREVEYCVIFSKDNRKGVHPPDLCLEGGGQNITAKGTVVLKDVEGIGDILCRELVVQSDRRETYYLYTYKCGSQYTTSFWMQQGTIFVNGLLARNASGGLIRVSTSVDPFGEDNLDKAKRRAKGILRGALPKLHRTLP